MGKKLPEDRLNVGPDLPVGSLWQLRSYRPVIIMILGPTTGSYALMIGIKSFNSGPFFGFTGAWRTSYDQLA